MITTCTWPETDVPPPLRHDFASLLRSQWPEYDERGVWRGSVPIVRVLSFHPAGSPVAGHQSIFGLCDGVYGLGGLVVLPSRRGEGHARELIERAMMVIHHEAAARGNRHPFTLTRTRSRAVEHILRTAGWMVVPEGRVTWPGQHGIGLSRWWSLPSPGEAKIGIPYGDF